MSRMKTIRNDRVISETGLGDGSAITLSPLDFTPTVLAANPQVPDDNNLRPFRATITASTPAGLPVGLPAGEIQGMIKRNGTALTANFTAIGDASAYTGIASTVDSSWVWIKAENDMNGINAALDAINGENV